MGTEAKWQRLGVSARSSAAAEKNGEGMALKIRTRAEDMLDGWQSDLDFEYPLECESKDNR